MKEEAGKLAELQAGKHPLETIEFESLIIKSENIADGIAEAGKSFDLVLLGASEERIIDQMLLGTIPEQVARNNPGPPSWSNATAAFAATGFSTSGNYSLS